ncbi:MAG TPA: arsenate reductase ArsC [Candidatus Aminicenantes bacterium]|nr:arsenate reductase ArsC [Candidatus Aminicenantes bacterium]
MEKTRVLFICVHNSARSQMAEAFLNRHGGGHFAAESAGLEPGALNPLAVRALAEKGIDIAGKPTRGIFELLRRGELFAWVITVCDESQAAGCPIFPGIVRREHWSFPDPAAFSGSEEDRMEQVRRLRDRIEARVREWLRSRGEEPSA